MDTNELASIAEQSANSYESWTQAARLWLDADNLERATYCLERAEEYRKVKVSLRRILGAEIIGERHAY